MRRGCVNSVLPRLAACGAIRTYFDPQAHQSQALFMDRKDLHQMYPTNKPWTVAGEYGYQRLHFYGVVLHANPCIRMPHVRRKLEPKPAETVVVFGASGFLGSTIVKELLAHPRIKKVRACTRYPTELKPGGRLEQLLESGGDKIELHECDVTDRIQVNVAMNGVDCAINAIGFHQEYAHNSHYDVHMHGAVNIAWSAKHVRCERIVNCNGLDATFASESSWSDFRQRGEESIGANFGDATLLRFGPLYGKDYYYKGLGRYVYPCAWHWTRCQPTWVVDAARAAVRCCFSQRAVRYKMDLGGPETYTHLEFVRRMSQLYHKRLTFPFYRGAARLACRLSPWLFPRPWFDDNYLISWELDMVNRNPTMFERLGSWNQIAYQPHTMIEAAEIENGLRELQPAYILDEEFLALEAKEKEAFRAEEQESEKVGIYRGKAEPGMGQKDGYEDIAAEIYPGGQFRYGKLKDAMYPDTTQDTYPAAIK